MDRVFFHLEQPCPEARYAMRHLFGTIAGLEAEEVAQLEEFRNIESPKIFYGNEKIAGAFHLKPWGNAERFTALPFDPEVAEWQGIPALFPVSGGDLPFDPLAASFFHLARTEEDQLPTDAHGRPETAAMHAARHNYLHRPVVDEWLLAIHAVWRAKDAHLPPLNRTYSQTATMDADNGAMYLGRPLWRTVGGMARDLVHARPARIADRLATLTGTRADPYAVHEAFLQLAKTNGARAIVNFIAAQRGEHDHAVEIGRATMHKVLTSVMREAEIGLHPGYGSSIKTGSIPAEKAALEKAAGSSVHISRQHYLRFRTPQTQRELLACGINEEHSMGLADRIGFRAGTCTPYPFFDRGTKQETALMVHPFAVMDSAMAYKMKLSPIEAITEAKRMVDAVRSVNGNFISVWHERFLSGYGDERGWQIVAPEVIAYARP